MTNVHKDLLEEREAKIYQYQTDLDFQKLSKNWLMESMGRRYVYNFDWLGRPIIQYPQDVVAVQELIWQIRPDVVIETGVAHGGSVVLSASILALLDYADAVADSIVLDPLKPKRKVIGIDIDIREHNRIAIEQHPMSSRISLIEGSSVDSEVVKTVREQLKPTDKVMVFLDSMHTHEHVLMELNAYAPMVSIGSYCVVFDTFVEDMPVDFFADRPWNVGNNPKTAVRDWVGSSKDFDIDQEIATKLQITVAPDGFLKRNR